MRLSADFLEKISNAAHAETDFMTPVFMSDGKSFLDSIAVHYINLSNRWRINHKHRASGIGGVMIVRKQIHNAIHGFPDRATYDDTIYVQRLQHFNATAQYIENLRVVTSSRRIAKDGVFLWLLRFTPEDSFAGRALMKIMGEGYGKHYGHY